MSNSLADLNRFGTLQQNRAPATTPAQFVCEKTFFDYEHRCTEHEHRCTEHEHE